MLKHRWVTACHWINNGINLCRTRTSQQLKSVSPRSVPTPKPDRQTNKYICLTWYNMLVNIGSRDITIPSNLSSDVLWAVWLLLLNLIFLPQLSWKRREMAFKTEALHYWSYQGSRFELVLPVRRAEMRPRHAIQNCHVSTLCTDWKC